MSDVCLGAFHKTHFSITNSFITKEQHTGKFETFPLNNNFHHYLKGEILRNHF